MGLTATANVITRSEYYGRRALLQPRNREWVTVTECTNASGWVLPPCVISKRQCLLNLGSTASRRIGDLRLVLMDGPLMKLDFGGLKSSLFLLLLRVRRGGCSSFVTTPLYTYRL